MRDFEKGLEEKFYEMAGEKIGPYKSKMQAARGVKAAAEEVYLLTRNPQKSVEDVMSALERLAGICRFNWENLQYLLPVPETERPQHQGESHVV